MLPPYFFHGERCARVPDYIKFTVELLLGNIGIPFLMTPEIQRISLSEEDCGQFFSENLLIKYEVIP